MQSGSTATERVAENGLMAGAALAPAGQMAGNDRQWLTDAAGHLASRAAACGQLAADRRRPESVANETLLVLDPTGAIRYCSDAVLFGGGAEELDGKLLVSLIPTLPLRPHTPGYNIAYAQFWVAHAHWQGHALLARDGRVVDLEVCLRVLVIERKHSLLVTLREALPARARGLLRLYACAENAVETCLVTDIQGNITYANSAFEKLSGYPRSELLGKSPQILDSGAQGPQNFREIWATLRCGCPFRGVLVNRKRNGGHYHEDLSIRPFVDHDGRVTHFVFTGRDVSEHYQTLRQLTDWANHDSLTGLPNRRSFLDRLQEALVRARRRAVRGYLLNIDLDSFKQVNDRYGHAAGDRLLQAVASGLRQCVRDNDTVARLGGDEFAVIVEEVASAASAERILRQIAEAVRTAVARHGLGVRVSASIGVCSFPEHGGDADDEAGLMARADAAMYRAKTNGGNAYAFFGEERAVPAAPWRQRAQGARRLSEPAVRLLTGHAEPR